MVASSCNPQPHLVCGCPQRCACARFLHMQPNKRGIQQEHILNKFVCVCFICECVLNCECDPSLSIRVTFATMHHITVFNIPLKPCTLAIEAILIPCVLILTILTYLRGGKEIRGLEPHVKTYQPIRYWSPKCYKYDFTLSLICTNSTTHTHPNWRQST